MASRKGTPARAASPINPAHYQGKVECIDAIESAVEGLPPLQAYLTGNCMKYLYRHGKKGQQIQDLEKAMWYLERLIATCKGAKDGEEAISVRPRTANRARP